jgi:prevent-host-death family protein
MQFINIHDAKTNLSKYLELLESSHEPIVICRNGKPVAQLVEYTPKKERKLGLLRGQIKIKKDFDSLPSNFTKYFE